MRDLHVHVSTVTFKKIDKGNNQQAGAAAAAAIGIVVVLFSFATLYAQPNTKYFCYKYKETKQLNDKWREPPSIEFIIPLRVTAKAWKYKGYMRKVIYRALRIAGIKFILVPLARYAEQKVRVRSF